MLRRFMVILVIGCIAAAAGVWVFLRTGLQGEGAIERWIGQQILAEARKQLNPTLSFSELDYQYPRTVVMKDLRLTAADPRMPAGTIDVIAAGEARMTLAELPRVGVPIVVENISLFRPSIRLIRVEGPDGNPGFAGISGMIKRSTEIAPAEPTTRTTQERLEDVLSINRIEIVSGIVEYDPRLDDIPPMVLDQITALLQVAPTADGLYRIQTNLGRKPIADSSVKALVDLAGMRVSELELILNAELDGEKADFLPPELQQLLKRYEATGELSLKASGAISFAARSMSELDVSLRVADANMKVGEYQFPLQQLDCTARLGNGQLKIDQFAMRALQGEVSVKGNVRFDEFGSAQLELDARALDLKEMIDSRARSDTSLEGTLTAGVRVEVPTRVILAKTRAIHRGPTTNPILDEPWPPRWGVGTLEVSNARLVRVPVLSQINQAISATLRLGRPSSGGAEQLSVSFEMIEDRIQLHDLVYAGRVTAGRGNGSIGLDQTLDLRLNGGPVEKMQSLLGQRVGGMIGRLTDSLASYRVTGTLQQPNVSLNVAPGLFGGFDPLHPLRRRP
ncbi:MAG TPA: hypothetical protein PLD59_08365 [Tepidisphaeraceae bacterium]|nr:hypothetical protein [Tepidisphaeraceae bacterium]